MSQPKPDVHIIEELETRLNEKDPGASTNRDRPQLSTNSDNEDESVEADNDLGNLPDSTNPTTPEVSNVVSWLQPMSDLIPPLNLERVEDWYMGPVFPSPEKVTAGGFLDPMVCTDL